MITLLCPIDYSNSSIHAALIALTIADRTGADMEYIHKGTTSYDEADRLLRHHIQKLNAPLAKRKPFHLNLIQQELEDYISSHPDEKQVGLVVVGTNGVDSIKKLYTGTYAQKIAGKSNSATLIIPENFGKTEFKKIIFLTDYESTTFTDIESLLFFANLFQSEIEIVHFSYEDTAESKDKFDNFVKSSREAIGNVEHLKFTRIIQPDQELGILAHAVNSDTDLIVLHKENFDVNDGSKTDLLTKMAAFPLLILR